jgi:alpha-acetolactate decarboxylase
MKKLVLWLARVFKVELPQKAVEVIVEKEVVQNYYDGDTVEGSLTVKGDLTINGVCKVNGELTVFKK